jgi:hypothetical protein
LILKDLMTNSVMNVEMHCLRPEAEELILQMTVGDVILVAEPAIWDRGREKFLAH